MPIQAPAPSSCSWNLVCQALSKMEVELLDIEVQRTEELFVPNLLLHYFTDLIGEKPRAWLLRL